MIHAEIAVAAPLEYTLTYKLVHDGVDCCADATSGEDTCIGMRVLVPLHTRKVTGYVVAVTNEPTEKKYKVRNITKFLDPHPLFHAGIIPFYKWIAEYYHYPLGLVIKAALPGGLATKSVKVLELLKPEGELRAFFGDEIPEWALKLAEKKKLSPGETAKLIGHTESKKYVSQLSKTGVIAIASSIQNDSVTQRSELCYGLAHEINISSTQGVGDKAGIKCFQNEFADQKGVTLAFSEAKAMYVLDNLQESSRNDYIALKDIRKVYPGASKPLKTLSEQGIVVQTQKRVFRSPFGEQLPYYPPPEQLSNDQITVLTDLSGAIEKRKYAPFLLHGVTGSGKTEVYIQAAEQTLLLGRDVLILVPEIGLATALEAHFTSRFGDNVVLLHSGMTRAMRFDQFSLALSGKTKIVIGARSAIFAPLKDPGLIIVDEEHDQGFKQDDSFRYNGRDLAIVRAKFQDSVVILGSATPSVTSFSNAQAGKYQLLSMSKRIGKSELPQVQLIDLTSSAAKKDKSILKKTLRDKIERNIEDGKQTILLINRRGFSSAVICRDCGTPVQCNHCHVSLTLHEHKKRLICHYCGFNIKKETVCDECKSADLAPVGIGIERVEAEVVELFPKAIVKRLDSDIAANRKKLHEVLREMHEGKIDILIGTQMIAKGHHFPKVTLVGVVWADGGMNMPDFRAAERTFQLITQVTGRAGRGKFPGDVIIQTMRPEHYSIIYARDHAYVQLYEREMELRKTPTFPPYVRLVALHIKGPVENMVRQSALEIARFCRKSITHNQLEITVLGPAPSPLDKIKDNYRWQVLLKGKNSTTLKKVCEVIKKNQKEMVGRSCTLIIDVDPENLM